MIKFFYFLSSLIVVSLVGIVPATAQSADQDARIGSVVEGTSNNVIQIPNLNNAQSNNVNEVEIDVTHLAPLIAPPNTENDLGFNLSVGANSSETTIYLGLVYQPGRSKAHQTRIKYLNQQIKLLEVQTQAARVQLKSLRSQITPNSP